MSLPLLKVKALVSSGEMPAGWKRLISTGSADDPSVRFGAAIRDDLIGGSKSARVRALASAVGLLAMLIDRGRRDSENGMPAGVRRVNVSARAVRELRRALECLEAYRQVEDYALDELSGLRGPEPTGVEGDEHEE